MYIHIKYNGSIVLMILIKVMIYVGQMNQLTLLANMQNNMLIC